MPPKKGKLISHKKKNELNGYVVELLSVCSAGQNSLKEQWETYLKVQELLKKVMDIEEPLNPFKEQVPDKKRVDKIDSLYRWADENGIQYAGIEIAEFPGYGLGLKAKKDLKKDDELFSIPQKLILTEKVLGKVASTVSNLSNVSLTYALMLESYKANSFWKPYIELLPKYYNTCLYYSVEEMEMLKGCSILPTVLGQCIAIARQYAVLYHFINNIPHLTNKADVKPYIHAFREKMSYNSFRWAVSTVMTRQNVIPEGTCNDTACAKIMSVLIPFWDLANHRRGEISSFVDIKDNQVTSHAQDNFKMGEQIFIHYGNRTSAEFLIHNAFIAANNPNDYVAIKLGLSKTDPLHNERKQLLELLDIPVHGDLKVFPSPLFISSELLAYVRVFNMNKAQLEHWIESGRSWDLLHMDCGLDTDLEKKTWTYIQNRLFVLLRSFPTTLEEDETTLRKFKANEIVLNDIKVLLLEYCIIEKRILSGALEYAKQKVKA